MNAPTSSIAEQLSNFCFCQDLAGQTCFPCRSIEEIDRLRAEGRKLITAYVSVLETGRERILAHGGICDSVERMEKGDLALIRAKTAFLGETTQNPERGLATIMEMVAVMEIALREIDHYSAGSTVQPVQIARDALRKLYGQNYRGQYYRHPVSGELLQRAPHDAK